MCTTSHCFSHLEMYFFSLLVSFDTQHSTCIAKVEGQAQTDGSLLLTVPVQMISAFADGKPGLFDLTSQALLRWVINPGNTLTSNFHPPLLPQEGLMIILVPTTESKPTCNGFYVAHCVAS